MNQLGVCAWLVLGEVVVEKQHPYDGFGQESFWFSICPPDPYTIFIICWGVSHYTVIHMLRW